MSDESTNSGGGSGAARTQPRLLDQLHNAIRRRYFSRRTEKAYVHWIKRFIYFNDKRHPATLGEPEICRQCSRAPRSSDCSRNWRARDGSTTMIYTHVLNKGGRGVKSPLDPAEQRLAEYCAAQSA